MGPSRDACDRCHTMKTRCQRTPQTRECVRCNRLGISCTYSPPGRTGRPLGARKGSSEKGKKEAAAKSRKGRVPPLVKTHMPSSMGRTTPGLDHNLSMMSDETSGVNPSLLGDFDLFSASAYQAELDYLTFPFMDSFLAESSGGDFTFAFANAMDAHPSSRSSGTSSPSGSSLHSPVIPQQQPFRHHSSSHHDHHRTWSIMSATTDPTDLDSPFPLFTENIFSPSFIPKPPQSQCFPTDENSCDDDDHSEEDVLTRLLDLQTRISNLVKRLHEGCGSSSNDSKDILSAGNSLIALLDGVAIPSRVLSQPASPMSTSSSSSSFSASSSSRSFERDRKSMPNNVLILSLSSCYATLLHTYELLLDSPKSPSPSNPSHLHTPLLSPASSISSMSSSPEERQGYFFSNGLRLPVTPITPIQEKRDDVQMEAMAQLMQKLRYALRRCTVRMSGQAGHGHHAHAHAHAQGSRQRGTSINKKRKAETKPSGDDDMFSVLGLASPTLLEMGWSEEVLWQQQQSLGLGMSW